MCRKILRNPVSTFYCSCNQVYTLWYFGSSILVMNYFCLCISETHPTPIFFVFTSKKSSRFLDLLPPSVLQIWYFTVFSLHGSDIYLCFVFVHFICNMSFTFSFTFLSLLLIFKQFYYEILQYNIS